MAINLDDYEPTDDLDSMFGDVGDIDTQDKPITNAREAVENIATGAFDTIKSKFITTDLDHYESILDDVLPKNIIDRKNEYKEARTEITDELKKSGIAVKRKLSPIIKLADRYLPKEGKLGRVTNKVVNKLQSWKDSTNDPSSQYDKPSEGDPRTDFINAELDKVLQANSDRSRAERFIEQDIKLKQFNTNLNAVQKIGYSVRTLTDFHLSITNSYYRKMLELKFKSLFIAKDQLAIQTSGFKESIHLLEGILKNTSLPDFIKARKIELLKQEGAKALLQNYVFKNNSFMQNIKNNTLGLIKKYTGEIEDKLDLAETITEAMPEDESRKKSYIEKISKMGSNNVNNSLVSKINTKITDFLTTNPTATKAINSVEEALINPTTYINSGINRLSESNSYIGVKSAKALEFLKDLTKDKTDINGVSLNNQNLNESMSFDLKTHISVNKVIPKLLSKILNVTELIAGKKSDSDNDLVYDYDSGKFNSKSENKQAILDNLNSGIYGDGQDSTINNIIQKFFTGSKGYNKKETEEIKTKLIGYIATNNDFNRRSFIDDGFFDSFKKKLSRKLQTAYESNVGTKNFSGKLPELVDLVDHLKRFKTSLPDPNALIHRYIELNRIDELEEIGIVNYNADNKTFSLDKDRYIDFLIKASKDSGHLENLRTPKVELVDNASERPRFNIKGDSQVSEEYKKRQYSKKKTKEILDKIQKIRDKQSETKAPKTRSGLNLASFRSPNSSDTTENNFKDSPDNPGNTDNTKSINPRAISLGGNKNPSESIKESLWNKISNTYKKYQKEPEPSLRPNRELVDIDKVNASLKSKKGIALGNSKIETPPEVKKGILNQLQDTYKKYQKDPEPNSRANRELVNIERVNKSLSSKKGLSLGSQKVVSTKTKNNSKEDNKVTTPNSIPKLPLGSKKPKPVSKSSEDSKESIQKTPIKKISLGNKKLTPEPTKDRFKWSKVLDLKSYTKTLSNSIQTLLTLSTDNPQLNQIDKEIVDVDKITNVKTKESKLKEIDKKIGISLKHTDLKLSPQEDKKPSPTNPEKELQDGMIDDLMSNNPGEALKRRLMKWFWKKGSGAIKWTFNKLKNIVKKDWERGKRLRNYLFRKKDPDKKTEDNILTRSFKGGLGLLGKTLKGSFQIQRLGFTLISWKSET